MHPFIYDVFFEEETSFLEQAEQEYGLEVKLTENHELHQENIIFRLIKPCH